MKSRTVRNIFLAGLVAAMTLSVVNVEARPGSSSATSSKSTSYKSTSTSSSSRVGSGTSSGMSRAKVRDTARQQSSDRTSTVATATSSRDSGAQSSGNSQTAQSRSGYSGTTVLGAVAAGYLLNNAMNPKESAASNSTSSSAVGGSPVTTAASLGTAPVSAESIAPAAEAYYPNTSGSGAAQGLERLTEMAPTMFGIMGFLVSISFGMFLFRSIFSGMGGSSSNGSGGAASMPALPSDAAPSRVSNSVFNLTKSSSEPALAVDHELLAMAPQAFLSVQEVYSRGDRIAAAALVDESYLDTFTEDMEADAGVPATRVHSLKVVGGRVLGFERQNDRYVGSIQYRADISEGNGPSEEIEEVWHFVKPISGGIWKLAGIEQV